jgi:hypothetical protein
MIRKTQELIRDGTLVELPDDDEEETFEESEPGDDEEE